LMTAISSSTRRRIEMARYAPPHLGFLALMILVVGLGACEPGTSQLRGDIRAMYSLDYDRARAYRIQKYEGTKYEEYELTLVYEKDFDPKMHTKLGNPIKNQVVRLTFDFSNRNENNPLYNLGVGKQVVYNPSKGKTVPIATLKRYVIQFNEKEEPVQGPDFPEIVKAEVTFDEIDQALGDRLKGLYTCTFRSKLSLTVDFNLMMTEP